MGYAEFKNKFINDISKYDNVKAKIPLFKSALDRAVEKELLSRDDHHTFQIRDFTNSENLKINYCSPNLMCSYSTSKKRLSVGTLAPSWSRGWKKISKDTFVSDLIDGFFHFANQYIHRGYQINLIGAIALTYGLHCDFKGIEFSECQLPYCSSEYYAFRDSVPKTKSKRNLKLERYTDLINSFDPFVNKTIHYYVRALSLLADSYDEEAITAADNTVDTIFQAIKHRKGLPTMDRKAMYSIVHNEIHLPNGTVEQLENLYQLRCNFSAHPASSKWWDFFEIYENDIVTAMEAVKALIVKFLIYEKENRQIEKLPSCWSEWFYNNCDIIYDAVWFHKLPILNT